eukprot:4212996-Ditylum_brightwellii.AAC.1
MAGYKKIPAHHCIADEGDGDTSGVAGGRLLGSAETSAQMSAIHSRMCSLDCKQDELCNEYCKNQRQRAMKLVWQVVGMKSMNMKLVVARLLVTLFKRKEATKR